MVSEYRGGDPGADPADEWDTSRRDREPYRDGGSVAAWGYSVPVRLAPDECVVVKRDGEWRCVRHHEHGDARVVALMNEVQNSIDDITPKIDRPGHAEETGR